MAHLPTHMVSEIVCKQGAVRAVRFNGKADYNVPDAILYLFL